IGGGILGYAQFPGTGLASTDGVVMSPQYFGSNNYGSGYYLSAPFDGGRTTTHEVGHYLNLRHIWGDGGCNVDDLVDDTPVAGSSNGGCPSATQNTCAGGQRDMHMNYMDYTNDDCMYMFSAGQKARMLTCLETTRASLGTATGGGGGNGGGGNTNCYATVGLDLVTDRYGSETTWTLKNAAGTTVESGSGYGNNTTTNLSWTLADGNYTFTINDSYGDGICCSYGNGSYTLVGDGSSFATNGAFGSSETVTFCVVGAAPACPNTNISLALTTDRYGSETSWSVTNAAGTTVESGNGYGNNNNYNILLNLPAGDYTFTINDSYGDGICCSYGNGSYTLNANGQQLTTGGNFGSSESFDFCAGGSNRVAARTTAEVAMTTEQVHLYPNPAGNTINVDLSETEETFTGRIVDATGRNVWVGELEAGANAVNISTLPAGLYYMAVVNADGAVTTKKFVKK
ncbi:MAG: zinc-dependent metalloprotease, partial [Aureispira sp.]